MEERLVEKLNAEKIAKKINDIEIDLACRFDSIKSISILEGTSGALIFYYLLHKLDVTKGYDEKFNHVLENLYERLNTDDYSKTYCSGLGGVAFGLEYLRQKGAIADEDILEALEVFDDIMLEIVQATSFDIEEYDFLHGAFGALFYLNERVKSNHEIREAVVEQFEIVANLLVQDITRTDQSDENIPQPNCGIAHGNISYIVVFSKFLENFPENELIRKALKIIVDHQLTFMSSDKETFSLFPSIVQNRNEIQYNTVLGWCYGDQSVAIGLKIASEALADDELMQKAIEIAEHTGSRNTVEKSSIYEVTDAGICHGMSGIAMNNHLMYEWTGNQMFLDNYYYFVDRVLERGDHPATKSGFRRYYGGEDFRDIVGFLDGTIGIGIFLISTLLDEKEDWERFFLLR